MKFYRIRRAEFWGDLSEPLVCGLTSDKGRTSNGRLHLERTGPFVPPIMVSAYILVSDNFRPRVLERFPEVSFEETFLAKIVELHWEKWDRHEKPIIWPKGPDPNDYIILEPNAPELLEKIPTIWEVLMDQGAHSTFVPGPSGKRLDKVLVLDPGSWNGNDLFWIRPRSFDIPIVTESAKEWLEETVAEWGSFEEVATHSF